MHRHVIGLVCLVEKWFFLLLQLLKEKLNSKPKRTGLLLAAAQGEGVAAFRGVAAPKVETKQLISHYLWANRL